MSKTDLMAIRSLKANTEKAVGRKTAGAILAVEGAPTASSGKAIVSRWVGSTMERMDAALPKGKRTAILRSCGHDCAAQHASMARGMRKRFEASADFDAFLAEETRRCGGGVRYERRGRTIFQVYEPLSFRRPMRCYCGLTKGLKPKESFSPTFCECSAGFVEATWETVLGRPVSVKLLESAVSGSDVCRFEVRPRPGS